MAKGFKHGSGGGASTDLKIVGNPRPSNPKEGTVWVNTDTEITGHILSATQPENPVQGMLWIKISDSSNVEIGTPLGKDYITIMLNSVSQYVGSAWKSVEAKSFQNGVWERFSGIVNLYNPGMTNALTAKGWVGKTIADAQIAKAPDISYGSSYATISLTADGGGYNGVAHFEQKDLTGMTNLHVKLNFTGDIESGFEWNGVGIWKTIGSGQYLSSYVAWKTITAGSNEFDIPINLSGKYYVGIALRRGTSDVSCKLYYTHLS
jgi:hypothetical protein